MQVRSVCDVEARLFQADGVYLSLGEERFFLKGRLELMYRNSFLMLFWTISKEKAIYGPEGEKGQSPVALPHKFDEFLRQYTVANPNAVDEYSLDYDFRNPPKLLRIMVGGLCLPLTHRHFVDFTPISKPGMERLAALCPYGGCIGFSSTNWLGTHLAAPWQIHFIFGDMETFSALKTQLRSRLNYIRVEGPNRYGNVPGAFDLHAIKDQSLRNLVYKKTPLTKAKYLEVARNFLANGAYRHVPILEQPTYCMEDEENSLAEKDPFFPMIDREKWSSYFDENGRLISFTTVKEDIFNGGIVDELCWDAMKYLLGYYEASMSEEERAEKDRNYTTEYERLVKTANAIMEDPEKFYHRQSSFIKADSIREHAKFGLNKQEQAKFSEVLERTLTVYCVYCRQSDPDEKYQMVYDQSMCPIMAVLYFHLQDEVTAFWLFTRIIERQRSLYQPWHPQTFCIIETLIQCVTFLRADSLKLPGVVESFTMMAAQIRSQLALFFARSYSVQDVPRLWLYLLAEQNFKDYRLLFCLRNILMRLKECDREKDFEEYRLLELINKRENLPPKITIQQTNRLIQSLHGKQNNLPTVVVDLVAPRS